MYVFSPCIRWYKMYVTHILSGFVVGITTFFFVLLSPIRNRTTTRQNSHTADKKRQGTRHALQLIPILFFLSSLNSSQFKFLIPNTFRHLKFDRAIWCNDIFYGTIYYKDCISIRTMYIII